MRSMSTLSALRQKFRSVWPLLDERTRRLMAANEAVLGYGGISLVRRASGFSRKAIAKGICELQEGLMPPGSSDSSPGGRTQVDHGVRSGTVRGPQGDD